MSKLKYVLHHFDGEKANVLRAGDPIMLCVISVDDGYSAPIEYGPAVTGKPGMLVAHGTFKGRYDGPLGDVLIQLDGHKDIKRFGVYQSDEFGCDGDGWFMWVDTKDLPPAVAMNFLAMKR